MNLSEDERKELEWLRKYYRRSQSKKEARGNFEEALFVRGLFSGIVSNWIIQYITPDTVLGRSVRMFGALVCFAVGFLSTYFGPFKKKKEVK